MAVHQAAWWVLGSAAVVFPSALITAYYVGDFNRTDSAHENHASSVSLPFRTQDAAELCQEKSEKHFGDRLLNSSVDWRSTRFESNRDLYLVLLKGKIGTHQNSDLATIYCHIDSGSHNVSYFTAYDSNNHSLIQSGVGASGLMNAFQN